MKRDVPDAVRVTFIQHDGARREAVAEAGQSLMHAARDHGVHGITADCGGLGACATCQVYVHDAWRDRTGTPSDDERDMLDLTNGRRANSRLSCQIILDDRMDGLVVGVPAMQT